MFLMSRTKTAYMTIKTLPRLLGPILCLTLLTGCVPLISEIFEPDAEGGRLRETSCGYTSGPGRWDEIELVEDDVRITVRTANNEPTNPNGLRISTSLSIPGGKTIKLASPYATMRMMKTGEIIQVKTEQIRYISPRKEEMASFNMVKQEADFAMRGYGHFEPWTGRFSPNTAARFYFDFHHATTIYEDFELTLPKLIINGEENNLPTIRYKYRHILRAGALCP